MNLTPAQARAMLVWLRRTLRPVVPLVERLRAEVVRRQAEADVRIAAHPDLAELDDWLDDLYERPDATRGR